MPDPEALKRTIHSAEDLSSVVRTMKTMAAVGIRQYEAAASSLRDFMQTVETGLGMLLAHGGDRLPELIDSVTDPTPVGAVIFGSDQGMCGQFNEQIAAQPSVEQEAAPDTPAVSSVLCVGHRVPDLLENYGLSVDQVFSLPSSASGVADKAHELVSAVDEWRSRLSLKSVRLYYNRREAASAARPYSIRLLPLDLSRISERSKASAGRSLPMWTMPTETLVSRIIRQWLFGSLFLAIADSLAAENAARIAAMQAAEKNIDERLIDLRHTFAQQRQTAITDELLDLVTGFEALRNQPD